MFQALLKAFSKGKPSEQAKQQAKAALDASRAEMKEQSSRRSPPKGATAPAKKGGKSSSSRPSNSGGGKLRVVPRATDEQARAFSEYKGLVLTAPGGPVSTNADQRKVIAMLDNGTCLVASDNNLQPRILEVKNKLKSQKIEIRNEYRVPEKVLADLYHVAEREHKKRSEIDTEDQAKTLSEFARIVERAAALKTSDIHVHVNRYEAIVRIRSNGVMQDFDRWQSAQASDLLTAAFNAADASDTTYNPYEGQGARLSGEKLGVTSQIQSLRLQYNPMANGGRQLIARILYASEPGTEQDVDSLGYSPHQIRDIKLMRRKPQGFNIVAGPTGSGKSTTLQMALTALMRERRFEISVQTIEDPPEYVIPGAAQYPILNAHTQKERSEKFTKAISDALRSDPDVIMIGEIRDEASAKLAFEGAMSGHQVWASLHANDALSILDRLRDMDVELYKLADPTLVTGLIGQRLMRALCNHCKIPLETVLAYEDDRLIDEILRESLEQKIGPEHYSKIYVANHNGCEHCKGGTGGRTVAAETIVPNLKFMQFVREDNKVGAHDYWLDHLNGLTMLEHATQKMLAGLVDPREVEGKVDPLSSLRDDRKEKLLAGVAEIIATTK
jgi:general secretion pathway protein E